MGRNKKYHTKEELDEANKVKYKRWYEKNKGEHNTRRMVEYYEKQIRKLQEKLSELREKNNL
jgi:hypothetical protein